MSNGNDSTPQFGRIAYRMAFGPGDNPFTTGSDAHREWDRDFWAEHDDASAAAPVPTGDEDGIEAGYGDYLDIDAVSQGMYDDDPSPYDGNYSEM